MYDCTRIVGNIDFCVSSKARDTNQMTFMPEEPLFWAEAKSHPMDVHRMLAQLVLTIRGGIPPHHSLHPKPRIRRLPETARRPARRDENAEVWYNANYENHETYDAGCRRYVGRLRGMRRSSSERRWARFVVQIRRIIYTCSKGIIYTL